MEIILNLNVFVFIVTVPGSAPEQCREFCFVFSFVIFHNLSI